MKKYFANEMMVNLHHGINLEIRSMHAWDLIRTHPNVAGIENGEDSSGRTALRLQSPEELVKRSFAIVDLFFDTVESRGDVQEVVLSEEEKNIKIGQLESLRQEETYNFARERKQQKTSS